MLGMWKVVERGLHAPNRILNVDSERRHVQFA